MLRIGDSTSEEATVAGTKDQREETRVSTSDEDISAEMERHHVNIIL